MNDGPQTRSIPQQSFKVCTGCKFLDKEAMLRGHKSVTDNYYCLHEDFFKEHGFMGRKSGRVIHYNHEGECTTPSWCPFLKATNS
jgi:hypothetical protein